MTMPAIFEGLAFPQSASCTPAVSLTSSSAIASSILPPSADQLGQLLEHPFNILSGENPAHAISLHLGIFSMEKPPTQKVWVYVQNPAQVGSTIPGFLGNAKFVEPWRGLLSVWFFKLSRFRVPRQIVQPHQYGFKAM